MGGFDAVEDMDECGDILCPSEGAVYDAYLCGFGLVGMSFGGHNFFWRWNGNKRPAGLLHGFGFIPGIDFRDAKRDDISICGGGFAAEWMDGQQYQ